MAETVSSEVGAEAAPMWEAESSVRSQDLCPPPPRYPLVRPQPPDQHRQQGLSVHTHAAVVRVRIRWRTPGRLARERHRDRTKAHSS